MRYPGPQIRHAATTWPSGQPCTAPARRPRGSEAAATNPALYL